MPTKGGREEKEQVSAIIMETPTTSLAVVDSNDNEVVTENLWKEEKLTNDEDSTPGQQTSIRNTSEIKQQKRDQRDQQNHMSTRSKIS